MSASPTQRIKLALQQVELLRHQQDQDPAQALALKAVKRFQSQRFARSYQDLLCHPRYAAASSFFLQELYADSDFRQRDHQFARMAPLLGQLLPASAVDTVLCLAQLHQQTEQLDHQMANHWLSAEGSPSVRYVMAWRNSSTRAERDQQLASVLGLGRELDRLVKKPGLSWLLRMMRRPAQAAGLSELQAFLEQGFAAFTGLQGAEEFLDLIAVRESHWISQLFDASMGDSIAALDALSLQL